MKEVALKNRETKAILRELAREISGMTERERLFLNNNDHKNVGQRGTGTLHS